MGKVSPRHGMVKKVCRSLLSPTTWSPHDVESMRPRCGDHMKANCRFSGLGPYLKEFMARVSSPVFITAKRPFGQTLVLLKLLNSFCKILVGLKEKEEVLVISFSKQSIIILVCIFWCNDQIFKRNFFHFK